MALDPSIPLSMPKQPAFAEQMGQAYDLAGAMEKQKTMQEQRQDSANLQQYLKEGGNLDTPEGLAKAMEWGKGNLSLPSYQTLVSAGQEMRKNEQQRIQALMQTDAAKIDVANKKNSLFVQSANPVLTQYEEDKQKFGEQQAAENFKSNWQKQVQNVAQLGVFSPQEIQDAVTWTPKQTQSKLQSTEYGQKLLNEALTRKKTQQDITKSETMLPLEVAEKKAAIAKHWADVAKAKEERSQGKPPPGYRWTSEGNLEAIPGGPASLKSEAQQKKEVKQLDSTVNELNRLGQAANDLLDAPGLAGITGLRGAVYDIPGTDAANAEALRHTLQSQVGFATLQAMREASKTGGALGQVSNKEIGLLQSNIAALDRTQDVNQMKKHLQKIISYTEEAKTRLQKSVESDVPAPEKTETAASAQPSTPKASGKAKSPVKITSDADWEALPKGTQFVGPDGVTRRK